MLYSLFEFAKINFELIVKMSFYHLIINPMKIQGLQSIHHGLASISLVCRSDKLLPEHHHLINQEPKQKSYFKERTCVGYSLQKQTIPSSCSLKNGKFGYPTISYISSRHFTM